MSLSSSKKIVKKHDFIIIGAGTSGCALAWRLAARCPGAKIAVLEEGSATKIPRAESAKKKAPFSRIPATAILRESAALRGFNLTRRAKLYKSTCDVQAMGHGGILQKTFSLLRGTGVGGTEFFTDGQYLRGWAADFKDWDTVGAGWTWEDVVPAYQALEKSKSFLPGGEDNDDRPGTEGPLSVTEASNYLCRMELNQAFAEACRASGMPLLGPTGTFPSGNTGVAINMFLKDNNGMRVFASDLMCYHLDENQNSSVLRVEKNIDLLTNHKAMKLDIPTEENSGSKKLTRVLCSNGEIFEASKEVLVAAGPIESAALLQRSGIGEETMLFKGGISKIISELPVGMTLVDRPEVCFSYQIRDGLIETRSVSNNNLGYLRDQWRDYKRDGSGIFGETSELSAFMEAQFAPPERPAFMAKFFMFPWDYRVNRPRIGFDGYSTSLTVLHPCTRGCVNGVASSAMKDGKENPEVQVNFMQEFDDRRYLQDGITWAQHLTSPTPAIGVQSGYSIGQNLYANSPFFKFKTELHNPKFDLQTSGQDMLWAAETARTTGLHLYGSCPMGTVVDEKLRVKGIDGVRVCGASVIPNSVSGSISTISMMTGVRCGDFVAAEYK